MRIVFFGLPLAALALQACRHEIVLATICRRNAPGTRRLRRQLPQATRVVVAPGAQDPRMVDNLRALKPDLIVSWFWTKRIPIEWVQCARLGGFGVHPSLLPRWRGPDPCFWTIDSNDTVAGVTAHRLAAEYDTGAILGQRRIDIDPTWNSWALARALDRPSLELLCETVHALEVGEANDEPQRNGMATSAPQPDEKLLELDWKMTASQLVRRIRAAAPYPGAWTFLGDEAVVITRATVAPRPFAALDPGEAAVVDGRVVVAAADGGVALMAGRLIGEDGTETLVTAAELCALVQQSQSPS